MPLAVWNVPSGYSLGTFSENQSIVNLELPVSTIPGVTYSIISGSLPSGLTLSGQYISGIPAEVSRTTDYNFCVRASNGTSISDRTLIITIVGADTPVFVTPEGDIDVDGTGKLFVLDNTYVDFQIQVSDSDTAAGQTLTFYLEPGLGQLPPGLSMSSTGRITGLISPVTSIKPIDGTGTYDQSIFDAVGYDFGLSAGSLPPKTLNRYYEFVVSVTDGDSVSQRKFRMFVVGDDYLRADNTVWTSDSQQITADATFLRAPTWKTPADLGTYRANNYFIQLLTTNETVGVTYQFEPINAECLCVTKSLIAGDNVSGSSTLSVSSSSTPKALDWVSFTKEFYAPAWVSATLYQKGDLVSYNNITYISQIAHTSLDVQDGFVQELALGLWTVYPATDTYQILSVTNGPIASTYKLTLASPLKITVKDGIPFYTGSISTLPPGVSYNTDTRELHGLIPYQPAVTKNFKFTITASKFTEYGVRASTSQVFYLALIGEIDSSIKWITDSNLGELYKQEASDLSVVAEPLVVGTSISYAVTSGQLPPGLTLQLSGLITGIVDTELVTTEWLATTFDNNTTTFTSGLTTFNGFAQVTSNAARRYTFTVTASDSAGQISSSKDFYVDIVSSVAASYSNISVETFLEPEQREIWSTFINDYTVFTPNRVFRYGDQNFGVQSSLKLLVYAGIETKLASEYAAVMERNFKKKRFQFGNLKKATAYYPGTKTAEYEVVYIEMIDPLEPNGLYLPETISNFSHNNTVEYYPSSITQWRNHFASAGLTERNFLPLWMRSLQGTSKAEQGFTLALVLCYCNPGSADKIILNINNYVRTTGFTFNQIDFTADRCIIDKCTDVPQDRYLGFSNSSTNI